MTDPVSGEPDDGHDDPDEPGSKLDAALGAFKPRDQGADTSPVSDSGRPRINWDPVTETGGGGATDTQPRSSFQFDLGSALARLSGSVDPASLADESGSIDEDPPSQPPVPAAPLPVRGREEPVAPVEPLPVRGREEPVAPVEPLPVRGREEPVAPVEPLPVRGREEPVAAVEPLPVRGREEPVAPVEPAPVVDRLPTRTPRSTEPTSVPADLPPAPPVERSGAQQAPKRSVFEDVSPAPTLPVAGARSASGHTATPTLPAGGAAPAGAPTLPTLPTLPASVPAAPPPVVTPIESAPSTPELNALRAAQLRANRNERQGKLFGRSLLAFVVLGALVAAALLFGRSYLFPTEWTAELTPLVDQVQNDRSAEFDETLSLVERPTDEYGPLVTAHVLGADWSTRLPEWRALGLAGGDGSVADVQLRVAALYPAFYDADAEQLVAADGVSPEGREAALLLALDTALVDQTTGGETPETPGVGLTGLESMESLARRAVDAAASGVAGSAPDAVADLAGVPLPVAYQLRVIDSLGDDLLAGVTSPRPGAELPESVSRLADDAERAAGGLRQPGDQQVLEPTALGADDWTLVWGTRLPPATVGRMADTLLADSYAVVNRSGATCFLAVFEVDTEVSGTTLLSNLTTWAAGAPAGAQAAATQLGPTRVQLEACDPGPDAAVAPGAGSVDLVLQRQLDRLADG